MPTIGTPGFSDSQWPCNLDRKNTSVVKSFTNCFHLILDRTYWRNYGVKTLKERLALQPSTKKAKNVILFIGDGMGVATHTAARIYKGPIFQ